MIRLLNTVDESIIQFVVADLNSFYFSKYLNLPNIINICKAEISSGTWTVQLLPNSLVNMRTGNS